MTTFPTVVLDARRAARTVEIETSAGAGRPVHRAVIWIVVDDDDERVLVRSVRGERGRWYRELLANPSGAVHVAGTRIPVVADPAGDAARVTACSAALTAKYRTSRGSLASMVRDEVLDTTLELRRG
jgi:hypothetical protein